MKWASPCENVSSWKNGQWRPRSACASAQSDQGLHCPLTEPLDTTECMTGEQRPGCYFAHAQDDVNMRILRTLKAHFRFTRLKCNLHPGTGGNKQTTILNNYYSYFPWNTKWRFIRFVYYHKNRINCITKLSTEREKNHSCLLFVFGIGLKVRIILYLVMSTIDITR